MDRMQTWRDAFRTELRAEAIGFACHGWPVVPGTAPEQTGRPRPVQRDWRELAGAGPDRVAQLWSPDLSAILLVTGLGIDVLDLPAELGRATAGRLRVAGLQVPLAATPSGRWIFPVLGGDVLARRLADDPQVCLHTEDEWVALPPSPCLDGVVHWRVKPALCGWALPGLAEVAEAVPDPEALPLTRHARH